MNKKIEYKQYQFSTIKKYTKKIDKEAARMEFIWEERDSLKDGIDIKAALIDTAKNMEYHIEGLKGYLKEFNKEDCQ